MIHIYLFTDSFPFGKGEQFLEAEVKVANNIKELKLTIVPSTIQGDKRAVPAGIKIDTSLARKLDNSNITRKPWLLLIRSISILKEVFVHNNMRIPAIKKVARFTVYSKVVKKWCEQIVQDNVIFYTYWGDFQTIGLLNQRGKVISRLHRYDLYEDRNAEKLIPYRNRFISEIDKIFSISEDGVNYLSKKYAHKNIQEKLTVSRLGVFDKYDSSVFLKKSELINIVSCSFITPVKRVSLIAEMLIDFANKSDKDIVWNHLGDGDDSEKEKLENILVNTPSNLKVNLLGHMDNQSVLEYYNKVYVDAFINLSASEGIPVSIMEAISFGMPVIGCDVGGMREIVINGKNGILLREEFQAYEFTDALNIIISAENFRKNSRKLFLEKYDAERNYREFYNELISLNT